jgi:2,3-bisphosphoglycerate-dependent phosphoglycerate mutase
MDPLVEDKWIEEAAVKDITSREMQEHVNSGPSLQGKQLVIIRHGKTTHNKLGLFTGWEDVPLANEGRKEARAAGELLLKHGIEFDVCYTSWLSRAIETAWIVLDRLDMLWLPMIKTWRLNERMYGALTGLSKKMVEERHGKEQFMAWRRGFETRPPSLDAFSSNYPGNDERYRSFVNDVRYSVKQSLLRSLSSGRIELHRKFPETESLKDCMDRTIPYMAKQIMHGFLKKNQTILVASSENAIRGMLMHLLKIPKERIADVEIPTGLPLVYDHETKRIRLLDDGTDDDILTKYNFGKSPELLFQPCNLVEAPDTCVIVGGRTYGYDPLIRLRRAAPAKKSSDSSIHLDQEKGSHSKIRSEIESKMETRQMPSKMESVRA